MKQFHVAIAAEAFAAGLLARVGCDVLVQYGANQPEYDLVVCHEGRQIRVSVKGSQDGAWGLTQSHKQEGVSYHQAVDRWVERHTRPLIFCFVQFEGVPLDQCPRIYLATIDEVAAALKATRRGLGGTILYEKHTYQQGTAVGVTDEIPAEWAFSFERVNALFATAAS